jgi:hypothetical protein
MNQSRPHPLAISVLINLVLFSAILVFGFPVFNSGDDVYLMYLLGGGFGQEPTELLHYNYLLHPYFGLVLKSLFQQFPNFNWYSAGLYLFHFISCTILLWQWMQSNKLAVALLSFAVVFFAIEARFLLQPTFTNTALITATGGMLLLYDALKHYKLSKLLLGSMLVLAACMFRIHMLIPVAIISLPFFLTPTTNLRRVLIALTGVAALAIILIVLQQQYYKQHIPGWQAEEDYRKVVIHHYNIPKKYLINWLDSAQLPAYLVEKGMLWDKEFLTGKNITAATKITKVSSALQHPDFGQKVYWLLMENRLSLLIFAAFLFYRLPLMNRRPKIAAISSAVLLFGLCAGLLLFRKLPPYVIPGCLFVWLAFAGATGVSQTKRNWLFAILGVLLLAWSIARVYKLNNWNLQQHQQFACAYQTVSNSPNKLFIVADDSFPMDFFHVWHTPHRYVLTNLLYKDHFLNNTYQPAYKKFRIISPGDFINNESVIFTGEEPSSGSLVLIFEPAEQSSHSCIQLWRLTTSSIRVNF